MAAAATGAKLTPRSCKQPSARAGSSHAFPSASEDKHIGEAHPSGAPPSTSRGLLRFELHAPRWCLSRREARRATTLLRRRPASAQMSTYTWLKRNQAIVKSLLLCCRRMVWWLAGPQEIAPRAVRSLRHALKPSSISAMLYLGVSKCLPIQNFAEKRAKKQMPMSSRPCNPCFRGSSTTARRNARSISAGPRRQRATRSRMSASTRAKKSATSSAAS
mmetsp:Transcript_178667/g.566945  ORF Transcript_178667/g.566945 Transcript_178667/m.566945 type:complete len:218 (-) Transcript_178667:404-1057(-)